MAALDLQDHRNLNAKPNHLTKAVIVHLRNAPADFNIDVERHKKTYDLTVESRRLMEQVMALTPHERSCVTTLERLVPLSGDQLYLYTNARSSYKVELLANLEGTDLATLSLGGQHALKGIWAKNCEF